MFFDISTKKSNFFIKFNLVILGEGYKIAIHNHMDQPIMSLSDIDLSPGFVTQLSVTPTLHETTDQGKVKI